MTLLIRTGIILIIALIIAGVTAASVIMGMSLTRRNLIETIENDMGVSGAIAEQLVAEKCRGLDDEQI